jgi:hypothetical protein
MAHIGLPLPIKLKRIEKAREKDFCFCTRLCYDGQVTRNCFSPITQEKE